MNVPAAYFRLPMPANRPGLDEAQWKVLTEAIFPTAKKSESILLAIDYCKVRGLDVMKRPIHIVSTWSSAVGGEVETIWPGINETETTAARTGQWGGMDVPVMGPMVERTFTGNRKTKEGWKKEEVTISFPEYCAVTVWRLIDGNRFAFVEPVWWLEAYGRIGGGELPNEQWRRRPRGMLIKVAKAFSLRAAFPEQDGSPTAEEMEGQEIEALAPPPAPKWTGPPTKPTAEDIKTVIEQIPPRESGATAVPTQPEPKATAVPPGTPGGGPAATSTTVEFIDPETGEITNQPPSEPHAIAAILSPSGAWDWREWGKAFVIAVRAAPTLDAFDSWIKQNEGALEEMKVAAPKIYKRVQEAIGERVDDLNQQPEDNAP